MRTRSFINTALLALFSTMVIVGCADLFAPGLTEATDTLTANVEAVASEQAGLTTLVNDGRAELQGLIDEARASIETISFRSEEDRAGAEAMLGMLEGKVDRAHSAVAEVVSGFDDKVAKLLTEAQAVAADVAAADSPGEAISVIGQMLIPFLGPYAPLGEVALGLLGLGGVGRMANRRGVATGAGKVAAPIENARRRDLEAAVNETGRGEFIVFDKILSRKLHGSNGIKAVIDSVT